jgi:colicin import membrane protein
MKKTYVYFLAPLAGLIIFGAIYWNFSKGFAAREAARVAAEKQKKEDKLRAQAKANEQAIREALAAQERRKAERAAKEAKDKKDHDDRQTAQDAKEKAFRDKEKFGKQVNVLKGELQTEKDSIVKLQADKKKYIEEQAFLRIYVKQAEDNVKSLMQVLDKIAAADAARATADALAASEAKKKNS